MQNQVSGIEEELVIFKQLLIGTEMPIIFNYVFVLVLLVAYFVLCIGMLSFHLRQNYRMFLNKKSEQRN